MLDRCTAQTRYRRFHGAVAAFPRRYLTEALSGSPLHYALVAHPPDARPPDTRPADIVALASCRVVDEGMAELGVLVEDAWQRRGIGSVLLRELARHAKDLGLRTLTAQVLAGQAWTAGLLRPYGTCQASLASQGTVTVTVRLAAGPDPAGPSLSWRPAAAQSASA
jgi:GNAT superfamily N-acetyltransferase